MLSKNDIVACPLCTERKCSQIDQTPKRPFFRCNHCYLVFVPAAYHLSSAEEKAIYDYHQNEVEDSGYRNFLSRLAEPLMDRLPANAKGLDFGCGPGPALAAMLKEHGHAVTLYDLYYQHHPEVLKQAYDFVTSTEVLEHLREPKREIEALVGMLRPQGYLGVMTKLIPDLKRFSDWHYTRDLTHICFYDRRTFEYLAERLNLRLTIIRSDVILLQKSEGTETQEVSSLDLR